MEEMHDVNTIRNILYEDIPHYEKLEKISLFLDVAEEENHWIRSRTYGIAPGEQQDKFMNILQRRYGFRWRTAGEIVGAPETRMVPWIMRLLETAYQQGYMDKDNLKEWKPLE